MFGAVAVVLLGLTVAGLGVYDQVFRKDSGLVMCEAMRDAQGSPTQGDFTESRYRRMRKAFADSRYPDIRDPGTKLVDTIWNVEQLPDDQDMGALVYVGPLMTHATALQSACADHGIMFTIQTGSGE